MVSAISETVKRFVLRHITGVWQLELLLLFKGSDRPLSAADAARMLYQSVDVLEPAIKRFVANGILQPAPDQPTKFVYQPKSDELSNAIQETERAYSERRVAVINLIFSRPLASFSDAFRIGPEEND